ncbi:MAG: glycerophosphodiester phosphodiesterase family protein [Pseudomonadota bacterium]
MTNPPLPNRMLARPIAHRGLHDADQGVIENSRAAVRAAVEAGYAVEIDIQPSLEGEPVVCHDATLDRLTGESGPVAARTLSDLTRIRLRETNETIPTLAEILEIVAVGAPIFVEAKIDPLPSGEVKPPEDRRAAFEVFARRIREALDRHPGPAAVMSFTPTSAAFGVDREGRAGFDLAQDFPERPIGLILGEEAECAHLPPLRDRLSFLSCDHALLPHPEIQAFRAEGRSVICWTIDAPDLAARVRPLSDQITFEGFRPPSGG